jgi:hypothetical protein
MKQSVKCVYKLPYYIVRKDETNIGEISGSHGEYTDEGSNHL